jgi:solute carrier family 25 (mitochondrial folate transporter), member 32
VLALHPLDVVKTRLQGEREMQFFVAASALVFLPRPSQPRPQQTQNAFTAPSHTPLPKTTQTTTVQDGVVRTALPAYTGTWHALRTMVATEGWAALYAGLAPALLGAGLSWGAYFTAYQAAKARLAASSGSGEGGGESSSSAALHLLAAAQAGAFVCVLTNPVWVVKTRLQLQRGGGVRGGGGLGARGVLPRAGGLGKAAGAGAAGAAAASRLAGAASSSGAAGAAGASGAASALPPRYTGVAGTVAAILREEGVRGLYRGLAPSLLLVSHGAIQFAAYEELRSLAVRWSNGGGNGGGSGGSGSGSGGRGGNASSSGLGGATAPALPASTVSALGAASKVIACVATYPTQVVRARLQQRQVGGIGGLGGGGGGSGPAAASIRYDRGLAAARTVLAREGFAGLYKGLAPTLLRVVPQSALTFVVYERVLGLLQQHGGGGGGGGGKG